MQNQAHLPPGTNIRILASAKAGHVIPCIGLSQALGVEPDIRKTSPRAFFKALAPWGPADPSDKSIEPPWPDIAIASARETVPALRALKRRAGKQTFCVFLGDPRTARNVFDLIWAPQHDTIEGANVIKTLTAPHPHGAAALELARATPDPRIVNLPSPRIACLIGGPSGQYSFDTNDSAHVSNAIEAILQQGASIMVTPSRRTPEPVTGKIATLATAYRTNALVWDGSGENPYRQMLAHADGFLVTADSVNMIGEALAAGKPVHVLKLTGSQGKFATFYEALLHDNHIRYWDGTLQNWPCQSFDATTQIAEEIATRYQAFKAAQS